MPENDQHVHDGNLRIPKNQKTEDFDFYELTADISNSITDQLYRRYLPIIEKEYRRKQEAVHDDNIKNDLHVHKIVDSIRIKTEEALETEVSELISQQVTRELKEQYHSKPGTPEHWFDTAIKFMRWFMVLPFLFIGAVMAAYILVMGAETIHMTIAALDFAKVAVTTGSVTDIKTELNNVVASILSILDLLLIGSLVIMVLVGGYENTISRIGMTHNVPTWFGKLDIAQLKIKVAASIIIISSIHLLMSFMQLDLVESDIQHNYEALKWTAIIHGVFVLSGIGLAFMDVLHRKKVKEKTEL